MDTFQQIILKLQDYWDRQGCALLQPYDMEVGAGTSHTATFLRALGPEPWRAAYVQPSRRPKDGRYGENPNRMQHYYQYQVVLKPSPPDILDLYLGSLKALGFDLTRNDVRFVEDDWENPTLGAWGLGWEVWLNGMEVTQFTYFQQVGGLDCAPITGEITYGLERLAMYLQGKENVFDLVWTEWQEQGITRRLTYGDVYHQNEVEQSTYNFEHSNAPKLFELFALLRGRGEAAARSEAGAARLRDDPQGRPHVQPARRPWRHFGHRARRLHRPHPHAVAAGRPGVLRFARGAWLPDAARARGESRLIMNATRHPEREHDSAQRAAAPSTAATLTVELLTEELPPKALKRLGEAFAAAVAAGLVARGFVDADPPLTSFATPRRLAVCLPQVLARSPDKAQRVKLLPASVGFDAAGAPTPALLKKLATLGLDAAAIPALERAAEGKAETLFVNRTLPGEPLATGLDAIVGEAIAALPIPKVMTYQRANGTTVRFVRPAHRLLALHGADIVPITALGLAADRLTDGHRFLGRSAIAVATAGAYDETLRAEGKVIAGFAERRAAIVAGLEREAGSARVIMPDALLDEVTALVEWPAVYAGSFDPAFLQVPQECLILTMQQNQKYFALASADGKLQNRFLVVSNLATADPAAIIGGNERVLRARLADAKFFFDQDRRVRLEARVDRARLRRLPQPDRDPAAADRPHPRARRPDRGQ